jgi:hypothetical protein
MDMTPGLAETHISIVFFVGDRAYKLKKPVALGFLDYSDRESRQRACEDEVRLNRRFSPDVYLGVADIDGPDGELCDHLVVMRRMPADRRLATLVAAGEDVDGPLRDVARIVAAAHAREPSCEGADEFSSAAAVLTRWEDNVSAMAPAVGEVLDADVFDRVAGRARRYIAGRAPLFAHRIAAGHVRDGHGDLLADDIFCLDDGPRILDCIEFDPKLRAGDVLADAAFLAMDVERLGRPDLGARFLAWYREFSAETWPESLAHHYIAYRSHVRAKIACLRHAQGATDAAGLARQHLAIADRHLDDARVRLVLVGGLPGTGKSTVAQRLADRGVGVLLSSDEVRKELAGLRHDDPAAADFGQGLYRPATTAKTYDELRRRAHQLLEHGESVILDASWRSSDERDKAARLATSVHAELLQLVCRCPDVLADDRLRSRPHGASDATPEIAHRMAESAGPWPDAIVVDTSGSPERSLDQAIASLAAPEPERRSAVAWTP